MRRLPLVLGMVMTIIACKDPPSPPKKVERSASKAPTKAKPAAKPGAGKGVQLGNVSPDKCRRTLCIAGPGELTSEANGDLAELCRRTPGIVQSCEGGRCSSVWPVQLWQQAVDGLVGTLDRNADGKVDGKDPECPVSLAGWSTGAAVVTEMLPKALAERVDAKHARVHHLLAIVPYTPGLEPQRVEIPASVDKAFIYRHSKTPDDDCSRTFEGGPWLSPAPVCAESTTCYDYDYSQDVGDLAYLSRRGARSGAEINHCNIVSVVAKIGLDNLARGQESYKELLPPYADGTHGGRDHEHVYTPNPE